MGSTDDGRIPPDPASDSPVAGDAGMVQAVAQEKEMNSSEADPISAALRKIHDSVLDEPLPDDFLDLLEQIDLKISGAGKNA